MTFAIHRITPANTDLLDQVDPDVFDHEIDPARLAAHVDDPLHAMFVAVEDGLTVAQIRGCVHLQPDRAPDLYIDNLGTAPAQQRRGIASALMARMLDWGKAQGCACAWVATETDNEGARGFYAAQGFSHSQIAMFSVEME